jgi:hypothetical protein
MVMNSLADELADVEEPLPTPELAWERASARSWASFEKPEADALLCRAVSMPIDEAAIRTLSDTDEPDSAACSTLRWV